MKKAKLMFLTISTLFMCGCGSKISQEDYDALKSENKSIQSDYDKLQTDYSSLQTEIKTVETAKSTLEADLNTVTTEYNTYKEKMKPFEKMTAAEAEAKTAQAKQKKAAAEKKQKEQKAAEKAAKQAAKQEAAAAKAAKEALGYETGITYDQLARTPDDFEDEKIKFSGRVVQVTEGQGEVHVRMAVDDNYDTILFCSYSSSLVSNRILDDDYITVYGTSTGIYSYESTMGALISIPSISVEKIDQ
jgi:DNA polymerase III alpha subunit (gram-positive type)